MHDVAGLLVGRRLQRGEPLRHAAILQRPLDGAMAVFIDLSDLALNLGAAASEQVVGTVEEVRLAAFLREADGLE